MSPKYNSAVKPAQKLISAHITSREPSARMDMSFEQRRERRISKNISVEGSRLANWGFVPDIN